MRFLLIADGLKNTRSLQSFLEEEAFAVDSTTDPSKGVYYAKINRYDGILIAEDTPHSFGPSLCGQLRRAGLEIPMITLICGKEPVHRLEYLSAGADDCLSKPYSLQELLARIRCVLRRGPTIMPEVLVASGITLNCRTHRVRVGRKLVPLAIKEFALLEVLMRNKGTIVSRSVILEHVWEMHQDPFSNTVEAHVAKLRRKLGRRGREGIKNIQGRGYLIEE